MRYMVHVEYDIQADTPQHAEVIIREHLRRKGVLNDVLIRPETIYAAHKE